MIPRPEPVARGIATSADGTRIAWSQFGTGMPVILFIPTWNLVDSRVVGHQVTALAPLATVLAYDPRGAGDSDRPPTGYDFSHHAADALAVLDATETERASVITASRGLNAAILLAVEHPERVERVAAIGPYMRLEPDPPPPDPGVLESWRTDWRGFIGPFMHRVFSEPGSEDLIEEMIEIGMDSSPDIVATQETELDWVTPAGRLGQVAAPVLVIHGSEDGPVPVSHANEIVAALPNARLVVDPNGGHRPDIRSPERINPLLVDFLVGAGRGRGRR